ncbi:glycosyltransferase family 4 protein [Streptomyces sp. NPDC058964]|uniref:glycosyltransferase family 4 protein n=1 Tax=Streptomyces sp. NPDC058964 TaxID=3346681 RepID=UPI00369FB776
MTGVSGRRILAVNPSADLYGSDRVFLDAIRSLRGSGASVEVILPGHGRLAERLRADAVPVRIAGFPVLRRSLLSPRPLAALAAQAWPTVRGLAASIRSMAPDVVYVNTITLPHWMAAGRKAGAGVICHVHELDQLPGPLASVLLSPLLLADRLVVNSQATQRYVRSRLPRVGSRVSLVHNGFDMTATLPPPPAFGRTRRLLLVGRLSPRKGQDLAIKALSLLVQRGHDVVLELAGDTFDGYEWYEEALRRQAVSLGLADRVEFSGYRTDTSSAYAKADVVLVPSALESFGNVAVEGLAAGRPVLATAVGGLPEIVEHGVNGFLFPAGDAAALAAWAGHLLSDPAKATVMGAQGARAVRARFGKDRFAQGMSAAVASVSHRTVREAAPQVVSPTSR